MIRALLDPSPDMVLAKTLVDRHGVEEAKRVVVDACSRLTVVELAALAEHWPFWARPKQMPPAAFRSWGNLTSRGWGKTSTCTKYINHEVAQGRAKRIGLAAQNELKTIAVQVEGLIAASPPWCRPTWEVTKMCLTWPNGAVALAYSPEVPGIIRSENFDLVWLSELQSWPVATMEEAMSNFAFATRVGYARTIWDATPKKKHPLLMARLALSKMAPEEHVIVRGQIYENPHLNRAAVADLEREYGGTQKGREELLGEMLEDSENAIVRQQWIEDARRHMPERLARKAIGIDPSGSDRSGNDQTGISLAGIGMDGQAYVIGDYTGHMNADAWSKVVLDLYVHHRCDCIVAERNYGGSLVVGILRTVATLHGLHVVVVGKGETPTWQPGIVNVREVFAQGSKEDRAQPLATAYERGRISHVIGADLRELEEVLTTWEPSKRRRSPDRMDALVHVVGELLSLTEDRPNPKTAFTGIVAASQALQGKGQPPKRSLNMATLLGGSGRPRGL